MNKNTQFGKLRLSVEGTSNGSGFDIFYDFGKSLEFGEFTSKSEFYFIQPWMQFPSKEYSDTCKLVSIELVRRFNEFPRLEEENQRLRQELNENAHENRRTGSGSNRENN
jgi:hypothetical protein